MEQFLATRTVELCIEIGRGQHAGHSVVVFLYLGISFATEDGSGWSRRWALSVHSPQTPANPKSSPSAAAEKQMRDTVFLPACPFEEAGRWDDAASLKERAFE